MKDIFWEEDVETILALPVHQAETIHLLGILVNMGVSVLKVLIKYAEMIYLGRGVEKEHKAAVAMHQT